MLQLSCKTIAPKIEALLGEILVKLEFVASFLNPSKLFSQGYLSNHFILFVIFQKPQFVKNSSDIFNWLLHSRCVKFSKSNWNSNFFFRFCIKIQNIPWIFSVEIATSLYISHLDAHFLMLHAIRMLVRAEFCVRCEFEYKLNVIFGIIKNFAWGIFFRQYQMHWNGIVFTKKREASFTGIMC